MGENEKVKWADLQCLGVPYFHCLVKGAGYEHACVMGIPLNSFHTKLVHMAAGPK